MKIKKDKASQALIASNPFDYLTSLKQNGRAAVVHDDIENMGKSASKLITSMDVDAEINIAKTIHELLDSKVMIPKDMKIDDRDLPTAKNFYEWVTDDRFGTIGDERPFLEQLIWGLVGFNDVCYKCSDMEWLLHTHKVDDTYSKLERKVAILENGVCPHCKMGRSEAVHKNIMPFYNELAINAGQRCVIGSTPTITEHGLLHMDEFIADPVPGFQPFEVNVHNGDYLETTSQFFYAEPEPVVRIDTAMGFSVTGTHEHPIKRGDEFVKLSDINVGDTLDIHFGQRIFGPRVYRSAKAAGSHFFDTVLSLHIRTADEASVIAFLQGLFSQPRRVFLGMSALRDVSALLLNAGYPHRIDGPCIILTDETFAALQTDTYSFGTFKDNIVSKTDAGTQATYDFTLPETHQFITGGILSHNSGKSHTVGTYMFPYLMHRLLKLQKPAQFYGLSRTTMLQGTFAALTYTQAKDTLWTPFYGALTESNWYKQYHGMLRHYENVYGERLFKLTDTFVDYRVRGLQCVVGDTLVDTKRGLVPIRDIVVGDKVKGFDGYSRVSKVFDNGVKPVFKVTTKSGYSITGTGNHPLLVLGPDLVPRWKEIDDICDDERVAISLLKSSHSNANLDCAINKVKTVYEQVFDFIATVERFTAQEVLESLGTDYKNLPALLSRMKSAGLISGSRLGGGSTKYAVPDTYTSSKALDWYRSRVVSNKHPRYAARAPEVVCENVARVLGYMIAEGSCVSDTQMTFYNSDERVLWDFAESMEAAYGESKFKEWCAAKDFEKERNDFIPTTNDQGITTTRPNWSLFIMTKSTITHMRDMGLGRNLAQDKFVPERVLTGTKAIHKAFIQALFEGDGFVQQRDGLVGYNTKSLKLAQQVQIMLAGFGAHSRLYTKERTYLVSLGPIASRKFFKKIGFRFKEVAGSRSSISRYRDTAYHLGDLYDFHRYPTASLWDNKCRPELRAELKKHDVRLHENMESLSDMDAIWEPVISIVKCPPENVYDITVDHEDHAFVANGFIQHNCHPMGPDKRVMRGRTRWGFSIDEIAYFDAEKDSGKVKINAFEVYDALANSLATVRTAADGLIERGMDDVLSAYAMNVSSPTAKNDMIHVLLDRARESRAMWGIHRATWDVNPNFKRNSKFITEAYRKDPESAEKNFAANPPLISNPFLPNHEFIKATEDTGKKNALSLTPVFRNSKKAGQSYMYGEIVKCKKSAKASLLAIDAGLNDNSFSIVGGTTDGVNLEVDLVGEIIPLPGYRINHSLIYSEIILPIMKKRNVKILLADRWNSIKLLDDARLDMNEDPTADEENGFVAKQHSLKYLDMVAVKTRIEQGYVKVPKSEIKVNSLLDALDSEYREFYRDKPVAHLFKQMFTIRDLLKGVGKGDGYTDDNWRAMALCLWGLQEEEYLATLMAEPMDYAVTRPNAIGASKLGSGAGAVVGTSGGGGLTTHNGAPLMIMSAGRSR